MAHAWLSLFFLGGDPKRTMLLPALLLWGGRALLKGYPALQPPRPPSSPPPSAASSSSVKSWVLRDIRRRYEASFL